MGSPELWKSWRTTLSGGVSSFAALALALHAAGVAIPQWVVVTAGFILAGGLASIGIVGKDAAVHSTASEVAQSSIDTNVKTAGATTTAHEVVTKENVTIVAETKSTPSVPTSEVKP